MHVATITYYNVDSYSIIVPPVGILTIWGEAELYYGSEWTGRLSYKFMKEIIRNIQVGFDSFDTREFSISLNKSLVVIFKIHVCTL